MKAVIPAAGFGTRFLPLTKAQPKEMLPVVNRPTIQWVVEEAVDAGITEIGIISLGAMPPQNTPEFTFRDIMPEDEVNNAESFTGTGVGVPIPEVTISQQEEIFTFNSFSTVDIQTSTIKLEITNNMFIILGTPIDIELKNIDNDATLGQVSFENEILPGSSETETMVLAGVTMPGTIKIIIKEAKIANG